MQKFSLFVLLAVALCVCACATQKVAGKKVAETRQKTKTTVIIIAKNGAVTVDRKQVGLKKLVSTLKSMGVTNKSRLAVEGESGADHREIEQVLETLVDGGLLPKGTID